jgi:hypothetical protein
MITPPTPLRIFIFFILYEILPITYKSFNNKHNPKPYVTTNTTLKNLTLQNKSGHNQHTILEFIHPYHIPLIGIFHILLVQFSFIFNLIFNENEKKINGIVLLENSIYYALCQAFILGICQIFSFFSEEMTWFCAIYFATYYAWFIIQKAKSLRYCTSSPLCLKISMMTFCMATVPYLAYYNIKKMSLLLNHNNNIYLQFMAWISADVCAYCHNTLCILYAAVKNISNIQIAHYE